MSEHMLKNGMRPVHPGEVLLEDYIKPTGISVRALSLALHVPYSRLREIVDGNRGVSADTALRLERYFGSEAQGWLNLQTAYDLRLAEKSEIPDHLFEYDPADYGAAMARNLNALPKIEPFWTIDQYRRLDCLLYDPDPDEIPPLGRFGKHMRLEYQLRKDFGYVLATRELMDTLAAFLRGRRVLEVGCGSGYLSLELTRLGVSTFAVDRVDYRLPNTGYPIDRVYQLDHCGDALPFVASDDFDAVLMTWPPYQQSFALDVVTAMRPGQIFVYCGETAGGNCADQAFFTYLSNQDQWERLTELTERLDAVHVNFVASHDHWLAFKKLV